MSKSPQPASLSVLEPRATNVFTGLWRSLVRQKDPLAASISTAAVLSKFLPVHLAGVPFVPAQTWRVHEICVWVTVSLLVIMILVLGLHMWRVKWPSHHHVNSQATSRYSSGGVGSGSVDTSTLAGILWYVCDSGMLRDFERLSLLGRRERDTRVQRMGRMYRFGVVRGVSGFGESRVGIDYAEGESGYRMHSLAAAAFGVGLRAAASGRRPK